MATSFIISIPDPVIFDVIDAMSIGLGWTTLIDDPENPGEQIVNPESKAEWAKRMVRDNIKRQYRVYKGNEAVDALDENTTRQDAINAAETATENLTVT